MGGTVPTRAAQTVPELVAHAVYLTAFVPASNVPAVAYARMPENADALIGRALRANPAEVGAQRLDPASDDPAYRQQLADAFYSDVDPSVADAAMGLLTPDAPAGIALGATMLTRDGWGSVPRTYGARRLLPARCPRHLARSARRHGVRAAAAGRHVHSRQRDPSGPAAEVHQRGRRGISRQPDLRGGARRLSLTVPFDASPGGRHRGEAGLRSRSTKLLRQPGAGRAPLWNGNSRCGEGNADAGTPGGCGSGRVRKGPT
ncbi:hypothetical protein [Amycolatopsis sp.]|uniref:hypothetical protein n=1 Tax=Amycolatopsis sp. TaxID=37632 RepID=UPI0039C8AC90